MNNRLGPCCQINSAILVYATTSNRTRRVADFIGDQLCIHLDLEVDAFNINDIHLSSLQEYDLIVAGSPTYGRGELHSSWQLAAPSVSSLDLSNSKVALFALGDQRYHKETFGRALKHLHVAFALTGALLVGRTLVAEYQFMHCPDFAQDGTLPGLLLDEITQKRLSHQRIEKWIASVLKECSMHPRMSDVAPSLIG